MNSLVKRIITGLVLIAVVLVVIAYAPPVLFACFVALVVLLAGYEWFGLIIDSMRARICLMIALVALGIIYQISPQIPLLALVCFGLTWIAVLLGFVQVLCYARGAAKGFVTKPWLRIVIALCILAGAFHLIVIMRMRGTFWLVYLIALAVAMDTGAYTAGRLLGRKKLSPNVSPNKTWNGVLGGLVVMLLTTTGVLLYLKHFVQVGLGIWCFAFGLTLLFGVLAVYGDLYESVQKRIAKKKDSSNLLPGHGGVMDRVDALLFMVPLMPIFKAFLFVMLMAHGQTHL